MQRYLIELEYIGKDFSGSQKQPEQVPDSSKSVKTIQNELEKAISTLTKTMREFMLKGRPPTLTVSMK